MVKGEEIMSNIADMKIVFEITMSPKPTEKDSSGCDGLYVKDFRIVNKPLSNMNCDRCNYLSELYEQVEKTSRNYYVMTELFVLLHGKDYCAPLMDEEMYIIPRGC